MPDADTIAQAAIELVVDGRNAVEQTRATLNQMQNDADDFAADFASKMAEAISRMGGDEAIGQFVAESAAAAGESIEGLMAILDEAGVKFQQSQEDVIGLANTYKEQLSERMESALNSAAFEMQNLGAVTPETVMELKQLAEAASKVAMAGDAMSGKLQLANQMIQQSGQAAEKASGLQGMLDQGLKALGVDFGTASSFASQFGVNLGQIVKTGPQVFAVIKIFDLFKKTLDEAAKVAFRVEEADFRMEVSARAAQRAFGDQAMSLAEVREQADYLSETYGTAIEITRELIGTAIRNTMEMRLTKEQIKDLTESAVVMSEALGTDARSALTMITMYMNTGYGRALSRLGLNVGAAAQQQQAFAMGINKTLKEMTESEKQAVRYALVTQQISRYSEDAANATENYTKKLEHTRNELNTARNALGEFLIAQKTEMQELWLNTQRVFTEGITAFIQAITTARAIATGVFASWSAQVKDALAGQYKDSAYYMKLGQEARDAAMKEYLDGWLGAVTGLGDAFDEAQTEAEDFAQGVEDAFSQLEPTFDKLISDFLAAKAKLQKEYDDALFELDDQTAKARTKAQADLSKDLNDIDADAAEKRMDTTRDYQTEEIRETEDHYRRLKDLETQYLFDLQDAVRERDARQVLLLQRRYNMEKANEEEEFIVSRRRRLQDYQQELRDIEEQRIRKRQRRFQEFLEQMADIQAQADARRAELKKQFDADMQVLRDSLALAITEAINQLVTDGVLSPEQGAALGALFGRRFGYQVGAEVAKAVNTVMGQAAAALQAFVMSAQVLSNLSAMQQANYMGQVQSTPGTLPGAYGGGEPKSGGYYGGGFAVGGDFVATSPQTITVGERPERVSIQPLNRGTGEPAGTMGGGQKGGRTGGKVEVAIGLGEGLEGRIVDQTLSEVADVFVTLNKGDEARGAGGRR